MVPNHIFDGYMMFYRWSMSAENHKRKKKISKWQIQLHMFDFDIRKSGPQHTIIIVAERFLWLRPYRRPPKDWKLKEKCIIIRRPGA